MIEDVFALCFGSVEGDGALVLGAAALPPGVSLLYTPLLRSQVGFLRHLRPSEDDHRAEHETTGSRKCLLLSLSLRCLSHSSSGYGSPILRHAPMPDGRSRCKPGCVLQAHPHYYLVRLARIGISGTDIDSPEVRNPIIDKHLLS